jgi:hypothetical protein
MLPPSDGRRMLTATLDVDTDGDAVGFTLTVTNEGDEPVSLTFSDSQRFDFVVSDADGDTERWRWSRGQMFGQLLGSETFDPEESVSYEAEWAAPDPGSYVVRGELVDTEDSASAETSFSV